MNHYNPQWQEEIWHFVVTHRQPWDNPKDKKPSLSASWPCCLSNSHTHKWRNNLPGSCGRDCEQPMMRNDTGPATLVHVWAHRGSRSISQQILGLCQ